MLRAANVTRYWNYTYTVNFKGYTAPEVLIGVFIATENCACQQPRTISEILWGS